MNVTARAAKVRFRMEGMDCASCATKIETALQRVPGVTEVTVSVAGGTVTISRDDAGVDDKLRNRISDLGYRVEPAESLRDEGQGVSPAWRGRSACSPSAWPNIGAPPRIAQALTPGLI